MTVWAIGDLQGCLDPTRRLLDAIGFDPASDRLWFCGDLVNRGGESLETLRLVHSLRDNCVVTLGNHDLSLIAIAEREPDEQRKVNPDLQAVLFADDRNELLDWLRTQPLLHVDRELGWAMVHAGLAPKWTLSMAERHAREVERQLRGDDRRGRRASQATNAIARSSTSSPACAIAARADASNSGRRGRPARSSPGSTPGTKSRVARNANCASSAGTGARSG